MRVRKIAVTLTALTIIAILAYQIPAVNSRLAWRLELASVYFRGIIKPVGDLPTPIAQTTAAATPTLSPSPSPTLGPTATPQPSPTPLPDSITLLAPEWEFQDWNNCGPATLGLYLHYYGWEGDQYTISDVVKPERGDRNVNIEELLFYARNNAGWLQSRFRVGGTIELLKQFLAVGIPVMIEEGTYLEESYWPNDDQWAGHYLLVTGYDDLKRTFIGQDTFFGPNREFSYEELDENWKAYNRVFLLVYPPHQEEVVKMILGKHWDPEYNRQIALQIAQFEIDADPSDVFAWFNLGSNLIYFERYEEAAIAYDEARNLGWPQRMLRYQFGPFIAYFHSGRIEDLITLVDYNLDRITPNSEEAFIWRGWGYYRLGDAGEAIESFQMAYEANFTSIDAQYALDFLGASP